MYRLGDRGVTRDERDEHAKGRSRHALQCQTAYIAGCGRGRSLEPLVRAERGAGTRRSHLGHGGAGTGDLWTVRGPGTRVYRDSYTVECGMAFHASSGSLHVFLTAGHCGYTGSNSWYSYGYGLTGSEGSSLFGSGIDAMEIIMPGSQQSNDLYDNAEQITGQRNPILNETICASLSWGTNDLDCGTVFSTSTTWRSTTNGQTMSGATALNIYAVLGDSGSPMWHASGVATGLGVLDQTNVSNTVYFAKLPAVLSGLGMTLKTT